MMKQKKYQTHTHKLGEDAEGSSYAWDIAENYGLTYDVLLGGV
ncbi:hypothetical protein [Ruminococcus albus]|nr:hypothetical protein [Ruminococcus albus]